MADAREPRTDLELRLMISEAMLARGLVTGVGEMKIKPFANGDWSVGFSLSGETMERDRRAAITQIAADLGRRYRWETAHGLSLETERLIRTKPSEKGR